MPHVAISMLPGRDNAIKTALAAKIQELICEELKVKKSVVSVSIEEIEKENWVAFVEHIPDEIMFIRPDFQ